MPSDGVRAIFRTMDTESQKNRLLLVDGNYFAYRSFYAIREIARGGDLSKNAVFGFCHDIRRMVRRCGPEYAAVVWDGGLPDERTSLLPDYKQQRAPMPDELRSQIPLIQEACGHLGFSNVKVKGQEADDLIASYAKTAMTEGLGVIIATNDKDIFQIVQPGLHIYSTAKKHLVEGQSYALLGVEEVSAIWGVDSPSRIRDLLALTGDSSDNIPGVPGIGPKTASRLIRKAGGLAELMESPVTHANPRIAKLLEEHRATIERNLKLVSLDQAIPLPIGVESMERKPRHQEFSEFAKSHGFLSLAKDAEADAGRALKAAKKTAVDRAQGELWLF